MWKTASLTPNVLRVVRDKGTEMPFSGIFEASTKVGTYLCRQCGLALFRSSNKFHSSCGWPSFDEEISGAVTQQIDRDGQRIEIVCVRCAAHLGHVFSGEGFTTKNIRHCVNSLSLDWVPHETVIDTAEAIVAGGCFWGVEALLSALPGVLLTEVGYSGGHMLNPSYREVCAGETGHAEAVRVIYDPTILSYQKLLTYFFEIHDPTQVNSQGPDIGFQYRSAVFYFDEQQKSIALNLLQQLKNQGYSAVTQLQEVSTFWPAEGYHQQYYAKNKQQPYCHRYTKRF